MDLLFIKHKGFTRFVHLEDFSTTYPSFLGSLTNKNCQSNFLH
jgi:hypothetical protein